MENPLDVLSRAASMLETNQITQGKMFYRIITPLPRFYRIRYVEAVSF